MARWYRLSLMALILLVVSASTLSSSLQGQVVDGQGQPRFTKAPNGVITDRATGLDWYVGQENNWHQAKAWAEGLTVAGGGWRLPTIAELKAIYQKGASRNHMDPIFQAPGAWAWSGEMYDARSAYGFAFYSGLVNSHGLDYAYGRLALAVRSRR